MGVRLARQSQAGVGQAQNGGLVEIPQAGGGMDAAVVQNLRRQVVADAGEEALILQQGHQAAPGMTRFAQARQHGGLVHVRVQQIGTEPGQIRMLRKFARIQHGDVGGAAAGPSVWMARRRLRRLSGRWPLSLTCQRP